MELRRVTGALVGFVLFALSVLVAGIVWAYLTEYGLQRIALSVAIAAVGAGVAAAAYLLLVRYCQSRRCSLVVVSLLVVLLLVPTLSIFYPGKVTYSRFGLTVYGLISVPSLDITVSPDDGSGSRQAQLRDREAKRRGRVGSAEWRAGVHLSVDEPGSGYPAG